MVLDTLVVVEETEVVVEDAGAAHHRETQSSKLVSGLSTHDSFSTAGFFWRTDMTKKKTCSYNERRTVLHGK